MQRVVILGVLVILEINFNRLRVQNLLDVIAQLECLHLRHQRRQVSQCDAKHRHPAGNGYQ